MGVLFHKGLSRTINGLKLTQGWARLNQTGLLHVIPLTVLEADLG